jgi:hypothetical protein
MRGEILSVDKTLLKCGKSDYAFSFMKAVKAKQRSLLIFDGKTGKQTLARVLSGLM